MTPSTDPPGGTLPDEELDAGRRAATRRLAAVARSHPDAEVPTCPGWTVRRVAVHTGRIHRWVAAALSAPDGAEVPPAERPDDAPLDAWLLEGDALLATALDAAGPTGSVRVPGWERTAGWWRRRTCHETVVHAWDVEAASGTPTPPDTRLAVDGIAEVVEVLLPGALESGALDAGTTLHLHVTPEHDGGEWLITVTDEGLHSERRHAKGDVAVRGDAGDLLLWLWGRRPASALDVVGDASVARRFGTAVRL